MLALQRSHSTENFSHRGLPVDSKSISQLGARRAEELSGRQQLVLPAPMVLVLVALELAVAGLACYHSCRLAVQVA